MRRLLVPAVLLVALLAVAPMASAQTFGQLTPINCFSTTGVPSCVSEPGLDGDGSLTSDVAVTPDGHSVYAYSSKETLVQFDVRPDGGLTYVTCIGDESLGVSNPCPVAAKGLNGGSGGNAIGVSPDSNFVYTTGGGGNTVAIFKRDSTGHLTFDGCLANTGTTTCDTASGTTHGQAPGLSAPWGLAFSPDGSNLYVASLSSNAVVVFKRDVTGPAAGRLTFDGCLDTGGAVCPAASGSTHGNAPGLDSADGVAVSADGASVYVTGASGTVAVFKRDVAGSTPGRLTSDGCVARTTDSTCDAVPGNTTGQAPGIGNPASLFLSADGANVYVAGQAALAVFTRVTSGPELGKVTSDGCLATESSTMCDGVAGSTQGRAPGANSKDVVVSPDGAHVYTVDFSGSRVGAFKRAAGGGLTSDGCLANTGTTTCDAVSGATHGQAPALLRPPRLAIAPNGQALYVASDNPGSVLALSRYVPPAEEPPPSNPPGGGPPPAAFGGVSLSGRTLAIDAKGRGSMRIRCPAEAQGECDGSVRIQSASKIALLVAAKKGKKRKKIRTLARARFSKIAPGKSKKVRFKLTKKARRDLARKRKVKAVVKLSAHDARAASKSTSARVTLKAAKKKKKRK